MKNLKKPNALIGALLIVLALSACGKTKRVDSGSETSSSGGGTYTPIVPTTPTPPTAPTPTLNPPLSYEFTKTGNQTYTTGAITTDNVLKVKFTVGTTQGNNIWLASELSITIAVNGTEVVPTFTSSNYVYGRVGETSNVVDLSSYITPGVPVTITVKNPKNDFYCTYAPNPFYYYDSNTYSWQPVNPLYNSYPGCRKAVYSTHNWSGTLIVQTSNTQAI